MAVSETATARAWGLYLVDMSEPVRMFVAVPHPKSDADCEQLALRLWRAVPGSMLAVAAVHRHAAHDQADHARDTGSVFHHLWTAGLVPRGVPQIQIHGFADATAPEQAAVSTGAGPVSPAAARIADEIAASGLLTSRSWEADSVDPDLRAARNVQGIAADLNSWVWVHVEFRHDQVRREPEPGEPRTHTDLAHAVGALPRGDSACLPISRCNRPRLLSCRLCVKTLAS
jgi:hypothetical protein